MVSDWKFRVAFCLIASIYVIGINCDGETDKGPVNEEFKYLANKTIKNNGKDQPQIDCGPAELCKKANISVVTCKGNITATIKKKTNTVDYTCTSETKLEDLKLKWNYSIDSVADEKDVTNDNSWVKITLEEAGTPDKGGANVGLIIGIVVLVIAVLIGVVALLGYKGIGPLKSFFNN